MASVSFDHISVRVLDPAVGGQVLAEVGASDGLVQLPLDQVLIRLGHAAIAIGVADEEAKLNIAMGLVIAVDILRMQSYHLSRRDTGKLCGHAVAAESNGSNGGCSGRDSNLT